MKFGISFHLRDRKAVTAQPIYAFVGWKGLQIKLSAGVRIEPKQWNPDRQRPEKGTSIERSINTTLATVEKDVSETFRRIEVQGIDATKETVRQMYDELTGRSVKVQPEPVASDPLSAYARFIEASDLTSRTLNNHKVTRGHLQRFGESQGSAVTFEQIDRGEFWKQFRDYLLTTGMVSGSCWNIIKCLRAFVKDEQPAIARGEGFEQGTQKKLLARAEGSRKLYLSAEEIDRVRSLDLTDSPRQRMVRDLWLFLSLTGLRYSDGQRLTPEDRQGDALVLTTQKNRVSIRVPLVAEAQEILHRYGGRLPKIRADKAGPLLEQVMELAGINEQCKVISYAGTERREVIRRKAELIRFHSGKRSFVTTLSQRGVSDETLRRITGNSLATLQGYKVSTDDDAEREFRAAMEPSLMMV